MQVQICEECGTGHIKGFSSCRECGEILDYSLYEKRMRKYEEMLELLIEEKIRREVEANEQYSINVLGWGPLIFSKAYGQNSRIELFVYDENEKRILDGTFKSVLDTINRKTREMQDAALPPLPQAAPANPTPSIEEEVSLNAIPAQIEEAVNTLQEVEPASAFVQHPAVEGQTRGKGAGRGSAFRAQILSIPVTKMIRWIAKYREASIEDVIDFCKYFLGDAPENNPALNTVKLQRSQTLRGKSEAPEINDPDLIAKIDEALQFVRQKRSESA